MSGATIDATAFQSQWMGLTAAGSSELTLKNPFAASSVESLLAKAHVLTLASGTIQGFMKFYFFAREVSHPTQAPLPIGSLTISCVPCGEQAGSSALFLVEGVADLK